MVRAGFGRPGPGRPAVQTDARIDPKKIVVTGHSRYGKAAPYRFIHGKSERLRNIVGFAPYWFRPNFKKFVGKVDRLPIDQHLSRALVAPRALLATEGTQDFWTDPEGPQRTHLAARRVYEFLGARDRVSIRYRPVGHIPSNEDLLEFADHVVSGKPPSTSSASFPTRWRKPSSTGRFRNHRPEPGRVATVAV